MPPVTQPARWMHAASAAPHGLWFAGLAVGVFTHGLFVVTVPYLFWFLRDGGGTPATGYWWVIDSALCVLFVVPHSLLLLPPMRSRLARWMPDAWHGCLFCVVTCLTLWCVMRWWQTHPHCLWNLHGPAAAVVRAGFYLSWAGLFYSFSLTGFGYQTGFTPWWAWMRGCPAPRRAFAPRSLYRWMRHPSYLCFLGLIWFTPRMSADHALLTGIWTVYVFVGSYLKDCRMTHYLGDTYRRYHEQVPGFPNPFWGRFGARQACRLRRTVADSEAVPWLV